MAYPQRSTCGGRSRPGRCHARVGARAALVSLLISIVPAAAQPFPAVLELATLEAVDGFVINGIDPHDTCGRSVAAAGDVNGDWIDDLIVSAAQADPNGNPSAGETYVIFGRASSFPPRLELAALNGFNGFVLNGIDPVDVHRSYRYEQGFTFELNLVGAGDEARDAFVDRPSDGEQQG